MSKHTLYQLMGALIIFASISATGKIADKTYPVNHTKQEWINSINGLAYVQTLIHASTLPANEAFSADSILQAHIIDIQRQVSTAIAADTIKMKKP